MTTSNKSVRAAAWMMLAAISIGSASCKKFLDAKPDKQLVVPATLQDCQALMDYKQNMNDGFPFYNELSTDDYFLNPAQYNSANQLERDGYTWKTDADFGSGGWSTVYQSVLYSNQVLQTLQEITPSAGEQPLWNSLKGTACFFRAFAFFNAAQIWAKPYDATTAAQDAGIPLRLSPSIDAASVRASVKQTYDQIIADLEQAIDLLPAIQPTSNITKTRPCKAAALGLLARVYLAMREYEKAKLSADACLQQYSTLMDYNQLNAGDPFPIKQYNSEVVFEASSAAFSVALYSLRVDTLLYKSYQPNDLRKLIFFQNRPDGSYGFRGGYHGNYSYSVFTGIATDEMMLTRAECHARAGNKTAAMKDLNDLLRTRWQGTYTDLTAADDEAALRLILQERRKELLFRGLRWNDVRRLNKEPGREVTMKRNMGSQTYTLPPNDLRYVLLIPRDVLKNAPQLSQNPR